ncbi:MAG: hypothetical protein KC619_04185 [Myxococcales bacterium]|nr:hypothetical protein [Myxococcales bacterium]
MTSTALAPRTEAAIKPDGDRYSWLEILRDVSNGQREAMMHAGVAPAFEDLAGWEFAGGNTLTVVRLFGIRKFAKGFYEGPARDAGPEPFIQGYNIPVKNDADDAPHQLQPSPEKPKRFGFYRVHTPVEGARDARYPNALLLDYSLGGNGLFGPPLRDYVVQVYPDDPDLLLGKAYLALAGLRIPLSFFVLKRLRSHDFAG